MIVITTTAAAKNNTDGVVRIWLEGQKLRRGAFAEGATYNADYNNGTLELSIAEGGRYKVSKRRSGTATKPIIDLCNRQLAQWFPAGTKLTAVVRKGRIVIRRAMQAVRTLRREARLLQKLAKNEPLDVVSLFHGGGIMDQSIERGFSRAGIHLRSAAVVEMSSAYMDVSLNANPHLFDANTLLFNGPIQEFDLGKVPPASIMSIGMPCLGSSLAGRAKGKLAHAESHSEAGALFFTAMDWVRRFQPAITIIECVTQYRTSASMEVIRSLLTSWGYNVHEADLCGSDYGSLENRDRMVAIGVSKGLDRLGGFDMDQIVPLHTKPATLSEVLDDVAPDSPLWTIHEYLEKKEAADKKAGKGFMRQLYTGTEASINTITRQYAKVRSTDPHIRHPDPAKSRYTRLLTPKEHARIKGLSDAWVEATQASDTIVHECLGQSVCTQVFEAVGAAVGNFLNRAEKALTEAAHVATPSASTNPPAMAAA
jgi:DNA (cytosine-5)-methyltransferase 1